MIEDGGSRREERGLTGERTEDEGLREERGLAGEKVNRSED